MNKYVATALGTVLLAGTAFGVKRNLGKASGSSSPATGKPKVKVSRKLASRPKKPGAKKASASSARSGSSRKTKTPA
jgi:hypothetical protein